MVARVCSFVARPCQLREAGPILRHHCGREEVQDEGVHGHWKDGAVGLPADAVYVCGVCVSLLVNGPELYIPHLTSRPPTSPPRNHHTVTTSREVNALPCNHSIALVAHCLFCCLLPIHFGWRLAESRCACVVPVWCLGAAVEPSQSITFVVMNENTLSSDGTAGQEVLVRIVTPDSRVCVAK